MIRSPSVGLVLSGGGARGLAHIGVLRVLERVGIPVDFLAGTSMGGVIAAGYAAGMSSYDLERVSLDATQKRHMLRLVDPGMPKGGLIRGERVLAFFKKEFGEKTFSDLNLPLSLLAVDLKSHKEIVLQEGLVALGLRATTSVPGIFMPVEINGLQLVDGGLLNNLPVDIARKMGAEVVIAVDIGLANNEGIGQWVGNHRWIPVGIADTLEVFDNCLYAMRFVEQENKLRQFPPDVLICPELPTNVNTVVGYGRVKELITAGEQAAEDRISEIKTLLQPRWYWSLSNKAVGIKKRTVQMSFSRTSKG